MGGTEKSASCPHFVKNGLRLLGHAIHSTTTRIHPTTRQRAASPRMPSRIAIHTDALRRSYGVVVLRVRTSASAAPRPQYGRCSSVVGTNRVL